MTRTSIVKMRLWLVILLMLSMLSWNLQGVHGLGGGDDGEEDGEDYTSAHYEDDDISAYSTEWLEELNVTVAPNSNEVFFTRYYFDPASEDGGAVDFTDVVVEPIDFDVDDMTFDNSVVRTILICIVEILFDFVFVRLSTQFKLQISHSVVFCSGVRLRQVDFVLFYVDDDVCADRNDACMGEWPKWGVGAMGNFGKTSAPTLRWCCTEAAVKEGACNGPADNRVIVDHDDFDNIQHSSVQIPKKKRHMSMNVRGKYKEPTNGLYIMLVTNCNDDGRPVHLSGSLKWMTIGGGNNTIGDDGSDEDDEDEDDEDEDDEDDTTIANDALNKTATGAGVNGTAAGTNNATATNSTKILTNSTSDVGNNNSTIPSNATVANSTTTTNATEIENELNFTTTGTDYQTTNSQSIINHKGSIVGKGNNGTAAAIANKNATSPMEEGQPSNTTTTNSTASNTTSGMDDDDTIAPSNSTGGSGIDVGDASTQEPTTGSTTKAPGGEVNDDDFVDDVPEDDVVQDDIVEDDVNDDDIVEDDTNEDDIVEDDIVERTDDGLPLPQDDDNTGNPAVKEDDQFENDDGVPVQQPQDDDDNAGYPTPTPPGVNTEEEDVEEVESAFLSQFGLQDMPLWKSIGGIATVAIVLLFATYCCCCRSRGSSKSRRSARRKTARADSWDWNDSDDDEYGIPAKYNDDHEYGEIPNRHYD